MRYLRLFSIIVFATLLSACAKELSEREKLDNREKDAKQLEVRYLRNGGEVQVLAFNHNAVKARIGVEINNPNLKWKVVSNKNWCIVEEEDHLGSGSITLNLPANDGFDDRDPATLTFVAGQYRGASIQVTQTAGAFVISQPYFISGKEGGSWTVNVTTSEGTDWEIEDGGWLTASIGTAVSNDGMTVTPVELVAAANEDESRYGSITLISGDESDVVAVYQFGTDLTYTDGGDIFFGVDEASFSLVAPASIVRSIVLPDFASYETVARGDGTDLIKISFGQNVSDANEPRDIPVALTLNNSSATLVPLPAMQQDFTPSHGLNSAKGLQALARKVAEGGSTEPWEKDGVITVLEDINMAGVTDWAGIGTEEHPFSSDFDGCGFSIKNLSASKPIFNTCKDASVSNLSLDPLCIFTYSSGSAIGALAASAEGTTFSNCNFGGKLNVNAAAAGARIGGIVGQADTLTKVKNCVVSADITINTPSLASAFIGGVAGYSDGEVSGCEMSGVLEIAASPATLRAAGITPVLGEFTTVSGNSFRGDLNLKGETGTNIRLGGLYASIEDGNREFDHAVDKSEIAGGISIAGFASNAATIIYAGGFAGYLADGVSFSAKGYSCQTIIKFDHSPATARSGKWFSYGGLLGGCDYEAPAGTLRFEDITNDGEIKNNYSSAAVKVSRMSVGGIVGIVNAAATFKNCKNLKDVCGDTDGGNCGRSNGFSQVVGGIAGLCFGGNMSFENCENKANVVNLHYSNNPSLYIINSSNSQAYFTPSDAPAFFTACATGGIIGAFNYNCKPGDHSLTMTGCSSDGKIVAIRGSIGGIAGYANNALISDCSWKGSSISEKSNASDNQASDKGGIVGVLSKSKVRNCTARGNITAYRMGSAESANIGGIVGYAAHSDTVSIEGCAFYGNLKNGTVYFSVSNGNTTYNPGVYGGILGRNDVAGTTLSNNKFGGSYTYTMEDNATARTIEFTADNVASVAASNFDHNQAQMTFYSKMKPFSVSGTSYWNGN